MAAIDPPIPPEEFFAAMTEILQRCQQANNLTGQNVAFLLTRRFSKRRMPDLTRMLMLLRNRAIVAWWLQGESVARLAQRYGVEKKTIYGLIRGMERGDRQIQKTAAAVRRGLTSLE